MTNSVPTAELRLTVAKFLELSYRQKEGLTSQLFRQQGNLKLTVDQSGNATLSGNAGVVAFSASESLRSIGVSVRAVTVLMTVDGDGLIHYNASFRLGINTLMVRGAIDVEKLITTCSGILCRAARAMRNRPAQIDRELSEALEN